ncbi:MAG: hypothetical protein DWQ02_08370 [Bacteroidetes bacterium]|nr:MAG: hypothetical protein DWQ02_08370 [Bacteroidota bacterium]
MKAVLTFLFLFFSLIGFSQNLNQNCSVNIDGDIYRWELRHADKMPGWIEERYNFFVNGQHLAPYPYFILEYTRDDQDIALNGVWAEGRHYVVRFNGKIYRYQTVLQGRLYLLDENGKHIYNYYGSKLFFDDKAAARCEMIKLSLEKFYDKPRK